MFKDKATANAYMKEYNKKRREAPGYVPPARKAEAYKGGRVRASRNWGWKNAGVLNMQGKHFKYDDYLDHLDAQGWGCAICNVELTEESGHVDHNHITGIVRGILCLKCNVALGNFNDDIKRVQQAYWYLVNTNRG